MNQSKSIAEEVKLSFSGKERNRLFVNREGEFADYSGVSGLDNPADSRVFATWDFDRDGWSDIAVVNANRPVLNIYRNRIGEQVGNRGRFIAVRFVGGNLTKNTSSSMTSRDGYGAKVFLEAGALSLMREYRCGEGMAAQNSKTMLIGIGDNETVSSLTVQWPSGMRHQIRNLDAGSLVTFFEDPNGPKPAAFGESHHGESHVVAAYAAGSQTRKPWEQERASQSLDLGQVLSKELEPASGSEILVFTTMATWCKSCKSHMPQLQYLTEQTASDSVSFLGVPVDESDSAAKLTLYAEKNRPPYRLLQQLTAENRNAFANVLADSINTKALPSTIVTDASGTVLLSTPGVPTLSQIRKTLREIKRPRPSKDSKSDSKSES